MIEFFKAALMYLFIGLQIGIVIGIGIIAIYSAILLKQAIINKD